MSQDRNRFKRTPNAGFCRTVADLAHRMDKEPGSRNLNIPGVEYALGSVRGSAGELNSCPTSSAI